MADSLKSKSFLRDVLDSLVWAIVYVAVIFLFVVAVLMDESLEYFLADGIVEFFVRFPLALIFFVVLWILAAAGYVITFIRVHHWFVRQPEHGRLPWLLDEIPYLLLMIALLFGPIIWVWFWAKFGLGAFSLAVLLVIFGFVAVISMDTLTSSYKEHKRKHIGTL